MIVSETPKQFGLFDDQPPIRPKRTVVDETRDAIEQVEENADPDWKDEALQAVYRTCVALPDFISDDVWSVGELESTREDRALGPILLQARRLGWCEKTNQLRPSRRSHLSGKPVWRSKIAKP